MDSNYNTDVYNALVEMGFPPQQAKAAALKYSDVSEAVTFVTSEACLQDDRSNSPISTLSEYTATSPDKHDDFGRFPSVPMTSITDFPPDTELPPSYEQIKGPSCCITNSLMSLSSNSISRSSSWRPDGH